MGVNSERSMNAELLEGSVDGKYKRIVSERSNHKDKDRVLEREERNDLDSTWYGMAETSRKITPDGRVIRGHA